MAERSTRVWRIVVTGTCFALFGIGGLILGLLVFPVVLVLPVQRMRRRRLARRLVQRSFRVFVGIMNGLRGIAYEIDGRDRLGRPGQLIIANHPTLIDVVLIVAFTPAPACVVKAALFANPFTRWVVRAAGYISNAPTVTMIEQAREALRSGDTLVMFPEGTRTRPGEPLQFHRGAASVAVRGAAVLTPVFIRVDQPLLHKGQRWYQVPPRRPRIVIRVGHDIDLEPFRGDSAPRSARKLNAFLTEHFQKELGMSGGYNQPGSD